MITKIEIRGFKSIKAQDVSLSAINLFIGGNGVGKSNFISIFSLVRALFEKDLSNYVIKKGGADNFLHFGKKHTQEISFTFHFDDIIEGFFSNSSFDGTNKFTVNLTTAQDSLFIRSGNIGQAFFGNNWLKEFEVYHFHDTGDTSPIKSPSNVDDNRILKKDGSNIAAYLYYLKIKHPKHFFRIEKTIQSVAPFFERFLLKPLNLDENSIKLEWKEEGSQDGYFDAYNLSDGTLRFICLATLLMQPNPPETIIIDEPELGLHPVAINKLASLMRKISGVSQLIIATQSINLIDNFEPKDIIVADRKNNETVFNRLNNEELKGWLEDYSLGDVWGKNVFGGQPLNY